MFKTRVLSIAVLLPLVVAAILFLPPLYMAIISGLVCAIAAWEWLHMTVLKNSWWRFALLLLLILFAANLLIRGIEPMWVFCAALAWWIAGFIGICYYPRGKLIWKEIMLQPFVGLVLFVPAWLAFNALYKQSADGPKWVLLGCSLVWAADIGAYIFGKLWGKTKMAPHVSPGKTWAGFWGGLLGGCIIMLGFYRWMRPDFNVIHAVWLALITVLAAVVGDLVESLFKRVYNVKDSGNIIPGHGGVFDRIDSMLAAFPIYYLGLQILLNLRIMVI